MPFSYRPPAIALFSVVKLKALFQQIAARFQLTVAITREDVWTAMAVDLNECCWDYALTPSGMQINERIDWYQAVAGRSEALLQVIGPDPVAFLSVIDGEPSRFLQNAEDPKRNSISTAELQQLIDLLMRLRERSRHHEQMNRQMMSELRVDRDGRPVIGGSRSRRLRSGAGELVRATSGMFSTGFGYVPRSAEKPATEQVSARLAWYEGLFALARTTLERHPHQRLFLFRKDAFLEAVQLDLDPHFVPKAVRRKLGISTP
jgi:hypothetical protein